MFWLQILDKTFLMFYFPAKCCCCFKSDHSHWLETCHFATTTLLRCTTEAQHRREHIKNDHVFFTFYQTVFKCFRSLVATIQEVWFLYCTLVGNTTERTLKPLKIIQFFFQKDVRSFVC